MYRFRKRSLLVIACFLLPVLLLVSCAESAGTASTDPVSQDSAISEISTEESIPSDAGVSQTESIPSDAEISQTESTPPQEEPTMDTYQYVVVIGVDGAGAYFQRAQTPCIDEIFQNGAITYKMLTSKPTISAQCWGSMLHGVTPEFHGLTNAIVAATAYPADSKFPSFFRVIRENDPDAVLASFCDWNPINIGIVENGLNVHKVGGMGDAALTEQILKYLQKNTPNTMFVQFDEADGAGHSSGYNTATQLQTISRIDGYIGQIYDTYAEKGILDETLFIVTADHGGNGTSHGGWTDTEKYVMFAAAGKTVVPGTIGEMEVRDVAAVVLHALGYTQPETWTAKVPDNLFEGVQGQERPVYEDTESPRFHATVDTPAKGSDGYITNFVKNHTLQTYLTFDGSSADECGGTTSEKGKLYYVDGYFGKGVSLDDGCIALHDYKPGMSSFTASLWFKTAGVSSDPVLFSNKNWVNGYNNGFVLSLRNSDDIRFNMGDGGVRMDANAVLPSDYRTGWVHILLVVDREKQEIRMCYDFGDVITAKIPEGLHADSLDAFSTLYIGQDGTGAYSASLSATVDEFMLFDGAFDSEDIRALAAYYGVS